MSERRSDEGNDLVASPSDVVAALREKTITVKARLADLNIGDWAVLKMVPDEGRATYGLVVIVRKTGTALVVGTKSFSRKTGQCGSNPYLELLPPTDKNLKRVRDNPIFNESLTELTGTPVARDDGDRDSAGRTEEEYKAKIRGAAEWLSGQSAEVILVMLGDGPLLDISEWLDRKGVGSQ